MSFLALDLLSFHNGGWQPGVERSHDGTRFTFYPPAGAKVVQTTDSGRVGRIYDRTGQLPVTVAAGEIRSVLQRGFRQVQFLDKS